MEERENLVAEWMVNVRDVRAQVTEAADLRSAILFQNDVNALLAAVAALDTPTPRVLRGVEALFGILPGRATMRRLRQARARLRALLFPGAAAGAAENAVAPRNRLLRSDP